MKKTHVLLALAALSAVICAMIPMLFGAVAADAPRVAYITFDDGPTLNTPNIINTLDKYNAKATFFVLEERIVLYPDYIKQIINSGNAIGLHGVSHSLAMAAGDDCEQAASGTPPCSQTKQQRSVEPCFTAGFRNKLVFITLKPRNALGAGALPSVRRILFGPGFGELSLLI